MSLRETIKEMEAQVKGAGASVPQLCEQAGIKRSTWTRWKSGKTSPNLETWERALAAHGALIDRAVQQ